MARDIACGCRYLEENHFIHRSGLLLKLKRSLNMRISNTKIKCIRVAERVGESNYDIIRTCWFGLVQEFMACWVFSILNNIKYDKT